MPAKVSRTEVLIGLLAVLSILLVVLSNIMISKGRFPIGVYTVDLIICGVFVWDYVSRLRRSPSRTRFLKQNWYEPLAMVPAIALDAVSGLPGLSAGLRALRLVRFVRVVLVVARLKRSLDIADRFVERSQLLYLVVIVASIVLAAAFSVLAIEFRVPQSEIQGVSDALWWALSTVTTVGYGDVVPATPLGRIIGMILMVVGIGVMAALISQVSATMVESRLARAHSQRRTTSPATVASLQEMVGRVGALSDVELATLLRDIFELNSPARRTNPGPDSAQATAE